MSEPIRVLVVDDHPAVRGGMVGLVDGSGDMVVVGEADTGEKAVEQFDLHRPDVTLLDIRLPDISGHEVLRSIRNLCPGARVILFSAFDKSEYIYRGMQAGAAGYISKSASLRQVLDAIRAVHRGERHVPAEAGSKLAARVMMPGLTGREYEVLSLLARGRSNAEIGLDLSIAEGTVKAHVNSILSKLRVTDRTQAVVLALRDGIVSLED